MVSWEDCARNKGSSWGPCISDITLRVNQSCMPVIRQPNFSDKTWDVKMKDIPIVIGNHTPNEQEELQTISLSAYLEHFSDFMTNDHFRNKDDGLNMLNVLGFKKKGINLLSSKENGDSHVIMSSQACFLPIIKGDETKFNVALYNYQSEAKNPALLVIVSTAKGASAQIIEGKEQYLLFNHNGKKADFVGERVSDVRRKKGQKNVNDKKLSKQEKQDNVIVIVQVPLKQKKKAKPLFGGFGGPPMAFGAMNGGMEFAKGISMMEESAPVMRSLAQSVPKPNVEAAMVSVAERTKPVCICGKELQKYQVQFAYNGNVTVTCDGCGKSLNEKEALIYHCPIAKKAFQHPDGYDLCLECGDKQLQFDELRGLLEDDEDYELERNEQYPVRVTLQYDKATGNGAVNKEIMDDIVKQLEASQKQADFMGSLVTEYDPNRPTEWVKKEQDEDEVKVDSEDEDGDGYERIRAALQKHCGSDWNSFFENFQNQQVVDSDLAEIDADDLKELIPKMGPRKRFLEWMRETQQERFAEGNDFLYEHV